MRFWVCAVAAMLAAAPALAAPVAPPCNPLAGIEKIAQHPAHFIVFGELHGTEQAPATFGDAVCALSRDETPILVALELQASTNAALQAAWAGPERGFADRLVATMPEWKTLRGAQTSEAVLGLLVRLHGLKAAGRAIDVVAFTGPSDLSVFAHSAPSLKPEQFETWDAENIRKADALRPYRRVLVFVGNLHARKQPFQAGTKGYASMAMRLAPAAKMLTLDLAYSGGTAWNCLMKTPSVAVASASDMECGPHPAGGVDRPSAMQEIALSTADPAYDGTYFVGRLSASSPVADRK